MAFRRKSSSRRRSSGSRRRSHWETFFLTNDASTTVSDSVTTIWAKWPSGQIDDSDARYAQSYITKEDETLVRCIMGVDWFIPSTTSKRIIDLAWGLVTLDTEQPIDYELVQFDNTSAIVPPNPLFTDTDWLWHHRVIPEVRPGIFASSGAMNDVHTVSRAMRKLPVGTGILACMAVRTFDDEPVTDLYMGMWGRLLVKNAV